MSNAVLTKADKLARSEVGYREGPRNNETKFGVWFGMNFQPWCAIFLSWLSFYSGLTYLGKPWRFASTIAARDHAKRAGRWITTPTVGTIAMMAHTSTTGHVGFVIALLRRAGRLIVVTIEGNTNDQGAREGNGVWLREREVSSWDGYIVLDQTYELEDDLPLNDDDLRKIRDLFNVDGHDSIIDNFKRIANLEAVANRDIETLRPLIIEAIELIKADDTHGPPGNVDADAVVDELARRLTEVE